jgi:hypothetical protein
MFNDTVVVSDAKLWQLLYIKLGSSGDRIVVTRFEALRQFRVWCVREPSDTNQDLLFDEITALLLTGFSEAMSY